MLTSMESSAIDRTADPGLTRLLTVPFQSLGSTLCGPDNLVMDQIETLMRRAASLGSSGVLARRDGEEAAAQGCFRDAFGLAVEAARRTADGESQPTRLDILRVAVLLALDCGETAEARRLMDEALDCNPSAAFSAQWAQILDVTAWSDAWLIAAVRRDPPDEAALDALVDRYWKALFGRCQMLTHKNQTKRPRCSSLRMEQPAIAYRWKCGVKANWLVEAKLT